VSGPAEFLLRYGYSLLGVCVLGEQLGLPLPAAPVLLAMGAMAAGGHFSLGIAAVVATVAAVAADLVWYRIGRVRGNSVLKLLCRISLEPDSCVSNAKSLFTRFGAAGLVFSKFLPGFSTAAPPMAGMTGISTVRFALLDGAGSLVWSGAFLVLGFLFHRQVDWLTDLMLRTGTMAVATLGGGLVLYLLFKMWQRRRFFRALRMARIAPDDLYRMIDSGERPFIVDLRHAVELNVVGALLPGALHIPPEDLDQRHDEIPRDREIVLYCS
jgi:membrane protein DedA with SNARE-associated domain